MRRIATTTELQAELLGLLSYARRPRPSRSRLASQLSALGARLRPRVAVDGAVETTRQVWQRILKQLRKDVGATSLRTKPTAPSVRGHKVNVDFPSGARVELSYKYADDVYLRPIKWPPGGSWPMLGSVKIVGSVDTAYDQIVEMLKKFAADSEVVPEAQYEKPVVADIKRNIEVLQSTVRDIEEIDPRNDSLKKLQDLFSNANRLAEAIATSLRERTPR